MTKDLVKDIKNKKELKDINDNFVMEEIKKFLKQNPKIKLTSNKKSKDYKAIIKGVRAILRRVHSSFYGGELSIKERNKIYPSLYKKIFKITGKPKKILDLGCGSNPLKFKEKGIYYVACDINKDICKKVKEYLDKQKIKNKVICKDLLKVNEKADVCFLFKVLDVLDRGKGHKVSENLIKKLKCKHIVVSFPTKTLSKKQMRHPYRGWIERMLNRIGYKFKILKFENEIFYVIKKSTS